MTVELEGKYWDTTWAGRIKPSGNVAMNTEKYNILVKALWKRIEFIGREKLDIGCGTGIHAQYMSCIYPCWKTMWTGIDLAESAIQKAKDWGLNAEIADVYEYKPNKKFEVFLMLDSLEHHEHHELLAEKIMGLADEEYTLFGNVPLYQSTLHDEGGYERPMDIHIVAEFLRNAGMKSFNHRVYGAYGYPYMMFQGWSVPKSDKLKII